MKLPSKVQAEADNLCQWIREDCKAKFGRSDVPLGGYLDQLTREELMNLLGRALMVVDSASKMACIP